MSTYLLASGALEIERFAQRANNTLKKFGIEHEQHPRGRFQFGFVARATMSILAQGGGASAMATSGPEDWANDPWRKDGDKKLGRQTQ